MNFFCKDYNFYEEKFLIFEYRVFYPGWYILIVYVIFIIDEVILKNYSMKYDTF